MPRTTETFVLSLDTLTWHVDPLPDDTSRLRHGDVLGFTFHLWSVFFRLDGATVSVDATGKLMGTATVVGQPDLGSELTLAPDGSLTVPAEVGQWTDQIVPIPVAVEGLDPDVGGIFGFALLVLQPGGLDRDALEAGHAALADGLQHGLDDLITNFPAGTTSIPPSLVDDLVKAVRKAINDAIEGTISFWEKVIDLSTDQPQYGSTFAYFSQDDLPAADFDQLDFDPNAPDGPGLIDWPAIVIQQPNTTANGSILLSGAISRSRRTVGQGVIAHLSSSVRAVAGHASPDGFQHAFAATEDGAVTEWYWQGGAPATANTLARFEHGIVGLASYPTADGYQHVIVATTDGAVTELYWQGAGAVDQGSLSRFSSPIAAVAGWSDGNGFQHVLVATADGDLTELWWQAGEVGRGTLAHLDGPFVDAAGYWANGVHHALVAAQDGSIVELTWTGGEAPATQVVTQLPGAWTPVVGLAAYDAAWESHVIVGLSDGRVRELRPSAAADHVLHTDLTTVPDLRPIIDAYTDPSGYQHVIAADTDNNLHEVWWSPAAVVIFNP